MSPAAAATAVVAVSDLSPAHFFLHRSLPPFLSFPFLDTESDSKDGDGGDNNLSLPFSFFLYHTCDCTTATAKRQGFMGTVTGPLVGERKEGGAFD